MEILHKIDPRKLQRLEGLFREAHDAVLKQDKKINDLFEDIAAVQSSINSVKSHAEGRQLTRYQGGDIRAYMAEKADRISHSEHQLLSLMAKIQDIKKKVEIARGEREALQERVEETQRLVDRCRTFMEENRI